ncbi:type II toxin-antitoxin system RatA family toxin [Luteipulveratus mongoliensis]|uniref:Polyketide cyclase n=1 Tax=Luteipulveratus mongoliensis TaxID=571913 RepID=A0A0K1JQT2_9MICO|nr:SRPBCC family protein [Luteipulveratus mongoliensis]AKU19081.1 polyketide cyclase [Luteipulveratus mongoliensis]
MPQIQAQVIVAVPPATAFAVSQTTGAVRLRWDPFIHHQELLDDAVKPGKGVRTLTRSRHGLRMVSQYVSYRPPRSVGMTMVEGPWFFRTFGGGWRFEELEDGSTRATWKYTFTCRPDLLRPVAEAIGRRVLQRDIDRRIAAFAVACTRPDVVQAATGGSAPKPG